MGAENWPMPASFAEAAAAAWGGRLQPSGEGFHVRPQTKTCRNIESESDRPSEHLIEIMMLYQQPPGQAVS